MHRNAAGLRRTGVVAAISASLLALVAPISATAEPGGREPTGAPALSTQAARAQYEQDTKSGRGAEIARQKRAESPLPADGVDAARQARIDAKDKEALAYLDEKSRSLSAQATNLWLDWQRQETGWWCGPASVSEITNARGVGMGQDEAARELGTTEDGTAWWTRNWAGIVYYPVQSVLNDRIETDYYEVKPLSSWPTGSEIRTYQANLVYNVDRGWHLAGNTYEVAGSSYRLNNHPLGRTIWHWVAIYGYDNSGDTTHYADSIATYGDGYEYVQRYNAIGSLTIAVAMGERGYIA
ncbi:MAG: hypothetical protein HOV94_42705 [Saccharothrix sp.]|nr:hypothetical protein [Saccharothrix sp.]